MNILEALFGFTDMYQKTQKKRKTRIERKHVLENPSYGGMTQSYEEVSKAVNEDKDCESENVLSEVKELLLKADEILKAYGAIQESVENQDNSIKEVQKSVEECCNCIQEKIHSESVKSYRNVQAALDEMDKKTAKEESLVLLAGSLKNQLKCMTWFSVITLLVLIAYILFNLGVF